MGREAGVWLSHERLGYNYRMDELSAALGVAPISRIEEIIVNRERVAAMYSGQCSAAASPLPGMAGSQASSGARRRGDRKAKPVVVNIGHDTAPMRPSARQVSASQVRYRNAIMRA
jgi:hypothetical protein